jgi:hypothetical protein
MNNDDCKSKRKGVDIDLNWTENGDGEGRKSTGIFITTRKISRPFFFL